MIEVLALGIPILALMIPIVALLTQHQRKMAEIIHNSQAPSPQVNAELNSLRQDIQQLKELMHQQMIAIDSASPTMRTTPPSTELVPSKGEQGPV